MINTAASHPELTDFLAEVRKPARYIGQEFNSVFKDPQNIDIHFALCFPDAYEIGMSHLGIKILYHILNQEKDVYCQRCFAPWIDMEEQMRRRGIPLFSLETQKPLNEFDIIGFSLQFELGYTNVLNMLDLGGIPLRAEDRCAHPLIIAGGPCCCNPEPLSEFIDVFFIGEAEDSIVEFLAEYRKYKKDITGLARSDKSRWQKSRRSFLRRLSRIAGIYVPCFYTVSSQEEGVFYPRPVSNEYPQTIQRRYVRDLDRAPFFTRPPVPFIDVVHDRIALEIMRGCPNRCFFCQAGFTIQPVRSRRVRTLLKQAQDIFEHTGYDTVSFCALSSADYPYLNELITGMRSFCREKGLGISWPSLRVDRKFSEIVALAGDFKKAGLTIAPEAGSQRLRTLINKNIDIEKAKVVVQQAYRAGWRRLKLYFMIGLPSEGEEDLRSIVNLIDEFSALRKFVDGKRGKVSVGIANFIPKPHTPFQWLGMERISNLKRSQDFLRVRLRNKNFDVDFHDANMSFIEACLSRGDRRLNAVIEKAYQLGARFDAWMNMFNFGIWQEAFRMCGLDSAEFAYERRYIDKLLSWEYIDCGVGRHILEEDFMRSSCR